MEHGGLVGTVRRVLADSGCKVGNSLRSVVSLAIVKHVGRVEVLDVQVLSNVANEFVEIAFDAFFDAAEDTGR